MKIPTISVRNFQRRHRIDTAFFQRFAEHALALCLAEKNRSQLSSLVEIGIVLVSDRKMAALHRQYLDQAGPTDVITFQHGEIFISVDTAARNALRFKSTMKGELELYLVHGLLHLAGFNDKSDAESRTMDRIQQRIVSKARRSNRGGRSR